MEKIKNISAALYALFTLLLFATPVATALFWIFLDKLPLPLLHANLPIYYYQAQYNTQVLVLGFLVSMLPVGLLMVIMQLFRRFFYHCKIGDIFNSQNIALFKKLGWAVFFWVIAGWVYDALVSLLLSSNNLTFSQKPTIEIVFSKADIGALITFSIILLIAWIFDEALKISEDQKYVI